MVHQGTVHFAQIARNPGLYQRMRGGDEYSYAGYREHPFHGRWHEHNYWHAIEVAHEEEIVYVEQPAGPN